MGTVGSRVGNSLAQAFFASLKPKILPTRGWPTARQARLEVFHRPTFYNNRRRHSTLGHPNPTEHKQRPSMPAATA